MMLGDAPSRPLAKGEVRAQREGFFSDRSVVCVGPGPSVQRPLNQSGTLSRRERAGVRGLSQASARPFNQFADAL